MRFVEPAQGCLNLFGRFPDAIAKQAEGGSVSQLCDHLCQHAAQGRVFIGDHFLSTHWG
jgi:hypothetical protein